MNLRNLPIRYLVTIVCLVVGCHRSTPVQEISVNSESAIAEIPAYVPASGDWPAWRGPKGNAISASASAPKSWSESENVLWQSPVPGRGHSSPVVVGDQVIMATAIEDESQQLVIAFDRKTGTERWRKVVNEGGFPSDRQMNPKGTHANGTVACDDQHIFIAFLHHDLIVASALDFDGEVAWTTTLGPFSSKFGYAPSPCLYKSLVIFSADNRGGGYLVAVHRRTGEIVWRKKRSLSSSYSSPIVGHVAGKDQLLISGGYEVSSYDPNTGDLNWTHNGTTDATCGTMVWNDSTVFASGGYPDKQTLAVRGDGSGEVVWSNSVKIYEPSMLLVGSELYAVSDNGVAHCWDSETGKEHWKKRLTGSFSSSPVYCDGLIYVSNLSGTTFVFEATTDSFKPIAKNRLGDDVYATPAICNGRIFLRVGTQSAGKRQEVLYCIGSSGRNS